MNLVILVAAMIGVGLVIGWLGGLIWGPDRPYGIQGDLLIAIVTAVATGLLDWFVIPAMGFSERLTWIGVILEPPLAALLILWLVRYARQRA